VLTGILRLSVCKFVVIGKNQKSYWERFYSVSVYKTVCYFVEHSTQRGIPACRWLRISIRRALYTDLSTCTSRWVKTRRKTGYDVYTRSSSAYTTLRVYTACFYVRHATGNNRCGTTVFL
jgi:hypothetical protein